VEFDDAVARLDALVEQLEREGDERALELLRLVDAIHRPALERLAAGDRDHPLVHAVLAMYDLAEVDAEILAEEALDEVRDYVESHGGAVELLGVADGVVHVRMSGACHGCAGSAVTLQRGIEAALREHVPGFREVVAHEPEPGLLQIAPLKRPVFVDVARAEDLRDGDLRAVSADGTAVLLGCLDGDVYAVRDGCTVDGLPLEGGRLTADGVLVCPWHNCAYDLRSGRRVDEAEGERLQVVPIAVQDGAVRVAVTVA